MATTTAAPMRHSPLYSVPRDREIAVENGAELAEKWTVMSPRGTRSAVRTARSRLHLVSHAIPGTSVMMSTDKTEDTSLEVALAREIVDFAFSTCGEFLAVADAAGALHLFKSESARELFAYPIVAPSAADSDSIRAVVFATRAGGGVKEGVVEEMPEDLLVLTRNGVLIRLGNLRLAEIERTLAREASHNMALRSIMTSIQLQQTNVGRARDGARSILLGRRYPSSLFVTVANHQEVLSVWRVDVSGRQSDAAILRRAVYDNFLDGSSVKDAQFALNDRCLVVLSEVGSLSWWDWRELVLLFEMSFAGTRAFTTLDSNTLELSRVDCQSACVVALYCQIDDDSGVDHIQVVQIESISSSRSTDIVSIFEVSVCGARVVDIDICRIVSKESSILLTRVNNDTVLTSAVDLRHSDEEVGILESVFDDSNSSFSFVRCSEELRAIDVRSLRDSQAIADFEDKLRGWFNTIGQDLEGSRIVIESLIDFAKRLRQMQTSASHNLPELLLQHLSEWLNQISSTSYRWTTFTLLLSTVADNNSQSLASRWRQFCEANLLDVMRYYLTHGMMRPVSLLWQRHTHQDALQDIASLLESMPQDLPFSAYERWLQGDVVPAIVRLVERDANVSPPGAATVLDSFAAWVIRRIKHFAEKEDINTALKLCYLLKPSDESSASAFSAEKKVRWVSLSLMAPLPESSLAEIVNGSPLETIERLREQLEHMKYLETRHDFQLSLTVFAQETPATIAMSMLDRSTSAEMVPTEVEHHVVPYLRHCGTVPDPVLVEYVTEALESAPTTSSTSEQARLMAIIDQIVDIELRASAALLFFGSLLPPFSPDVNQFTRRCVSWDTRQIDVIQEHVRLMEIQDMLTSYGVARFQVGDARGGSRLVSHILAQITRESAFVDALQLVSAYSHLTVERAALEYFENMLTIESSTIGLSVDGIALRRSNLMKSAIKQLVSHFSSAGTISTVVSILEETASLGLRLLEIKEVEEEVKHARLSGRACSARNDGVAFFLSILETAMELFVSEVGRSETTSSVEKWGSQEAHMGDTLSAKVLSDIQRIRRMYREWGILVSVRTIRNPDCVSDRVRAFLEPDAIFSRVKADDSSAKPLNSLPNGKGKKRALASADTNEIGSAFKKARPIGLPSLGTDDQQDDRQTKAVFDMQRYATHLGMSGDDYHSLVAQAAAEHGDIIKAVQYSRDLFSRRRSAYTVSKREEHGKSSVVTSVSGLALKNISLSISKYTATHTEEIYILATQAPANELRTLTPIQMARMQAPLYSLELLQYAICVCDSSSFEETFLLLKNAMLSNDILRFTQLGSFPCRNQREDCELRIYDRWFREDAFCVLPSSQTMTLATRFAISEHRLFVAHDNSVPMGVADHSGSITSQEFLASKRFVSFLVENNADFLSLQVIMSMRWIPEDAISVIQSQVIKLVSTVFQSRNIDNFLALGLMLTMDQRDAFNAFRRQISRENVAKDFNRFQQLAKIGSDSARAWQQIAFLNQCVELEGNARWWHFLNLLEIECDHKAFQSERRDLDYIRSLVPTLLAKSSYDYYTIQEFTRHYQIEDSFPALVYVEALLTAPEATAKSLEYQDKIVGVLEDIHEQRLVKLLLKTLPKVSGTDYERLLFMFQLLLEHTSYGDKEEVERRIEVLHVLKAYASSHRGRRPGSGSITGDIIFLTEDGAGQTQANAVCFHRIMTKPREVLSEILSTTSFGILSHLDYPLRLESDELLMLLLKNVVANLSHGGKDGSDTLSTQPWSGSELERLFSILASLKGAESKTTAGEWLAEHLPVSAHKLRSLEFALDAAASSSIDDSTHRRIVSGNSTFMGVEAITRLEEKILRTKVQLILRENNASRFVDVAREARLLKSVVNQPNEVFFELYRSADITAEKTEATDGGQDDFTLHEIADRVAAVLKLQPNDLRILLIRELLVRDAVYTVQQRRQDGSGTSGDLPAEVVFTALDEESRGIRDEQLISKISSIAAFVASKSTKDPDDTDAITLVEYLVTFARERKPRAGVTFRAKLRAARTVLHLAQSHRSVVVAAIEKKLKLAAFGLVIKELVDYIRLCKHMISFEENRVPYEIEFVMRANKEALVRSLLRQHSGQEAWILRCAANLMVDFDVQAPDLWEYVLKSMKQHKMYRSLSRVLNSLSQHAFVRSIEGASEIWEVTLLSPLLHLKSLDEDSSVLAIDGDASAVSTGSPEFHGIAIGTIRCELERMVAMLQKCPFLEHIDVASIVVHLRDIHARHAALALSGVDLFAYAVRCAMVIPRPSTRMQALQRIIQSGAYLQVLDQVCDATVLSEESHAIDEAGPGQVLYSDHLSEQLAILEAIFNEVLKRDEHEKLVGSPFEQGFLEFLAVSGNIDRAVAIMLAEKRLEAASTLVEMYYESNPERAPENWSAVSSSFEQTNKNGGRWSTLQQYVAASTSRHLATYRPMSS